MMPSVLFNPMFSCVGTCMCSSNRSMLLFSDILMQVLRNPAELFFPSSRGNMTNLLSAYTQPRKNYMKI